MTSLKQIISALLLACSAGVVMAGKLTPVILDVHGGAIVNIVEDSDTRNALENIVSLFAVPAPGYRFAGWKNGCMSTLGPLCTLPWGQHHSVTAQFTRAISAKYPVKVLLLMQDGSQNASIWNEFAAARFHNRCPEIYGGMILAGDALTTEDNTYCYRLRKGYYDALLANKASHPAATAHEIQAALLGILNRHSGARIALLAQGGMAEAVRRTLRKPSFPQTSIAGMIALANPALNPDQLAKLARASPSEINSLKTITLPVTPAQAGKISKALALLPAFGWLPE